MSVSLLEVTSLSAILRLFFLAVLLTPTEELVVRFRLEERHFARISDGSFNQVLLRDGRISKADQVILDTSYRNHTRTPATIPHTWFPFYQNGGKIDAAKADVFALGCVMMELISGENPFPEVKMLENSNRHPDDKVAYPLIPRFRLMPKRCYTQMKQSKLSGYSGACAMLHPNPEERITAAAAASHYWIRISQEWTD